MNRNELLTKLHTEAMDRINDVLIELQDETDEVGQIPRRYEDWSDDDRECLWWDVTGTNGEIQEPPSYIGRPDDNDWPWGETLQPEYRLLWVPLPKLARGRP